MVINMKRLFVLTLALISLHAHAGKITLILSDEQETDNANFTEIVTIRPSELCKYTRTFEEE